MRDETQRWARLGAIAALILGACDPALLPADGGTRVADANVGVDAAADTDAASASEAPYDGGPRGGACEHDSDCPLGTPCLGGVCGTCCDGIACAGGTQCSDYCACVPACLDEGCPSGELCTAEGCAPLPTCRGADGFACPPNMVCVGDPSAPCIAGTDLTLCTGVCRDALEVSCGSFTEIACVEDSTCEFFVDECDPAGGALGCAGRCS